MYLCTSTVNDQVVYHVDNIKFYGTIFLGKDQDYCEEFSLQLSHKFKFYNVELTISDAKDPRYHTTIQWTNSNFTMWS